MKQPFLKVSIIIGLFFAIIAGLMFLVYVGYEIGVFKLRCKDCDLQELLPNIDSKFDITIPASAIELKTAKSPVRDSMTHYCVKLVLNETESQNFLLSFKQEIDWNEITTNQFFKYVRQDYAPHWMRRQGSPKKAGILYSVAGFLMLVESTNADNQTIIYMAGAYGRGTLEK